MIKRILLIMSMIAMFNPNLTAKETIKITTESPLIIGEVIKFHSSVLNEDRVLNIYLPVGYKAEKARKYPVIYLLDGGIDEDLIHIVGITQFASFPWLNMMPETIVVGIGNTDRKRDFTFETHNKRDAKDFPTAGKSSEFIKFLKEEVIALINKRYKVNKNKTIIGQSLGGLLVTEILFKAPELFDNYIIVSPSLWWDDESLLKYTPKPVANISSIYIAVGKEGRVMERTAKSLFKKLAKTKLDRRKLYFQFFPDKNHGDTLHTAVYDAIEKIFRQSKKI